MKILLDTHILLWTLTGSSFLPDNVKELINDPDNDIYVSIVSPWEVEIKHDKYPDRMPIDSNKLIQYCALSGFSRLGIRPSHIAMLSGLGNGRHNDPFDRMLLCQAKAEDMMLITHDKRLGEYDYCRLLLV